VQQDELEIRAVSTSKPPEFTPEQVSLFRDVLHILNERSVPYAVAGAFALHQHSGIWRNTKDLDLFLQAEHVPTAMDHLRSVGLQCEVVDPVWLAKARRGDYFVDLITGMSNGIVRVDQSWIDRSVPATILDVRTRVLAAEELLASKLFVLFRERYDGADIVHIVYVTRGRLDWERILTLTGQNWELLLSVLVLFQYVYPGCSDYVPQEVWNRLVDKLRRRVTQPEPKTKFRGTLLDEKMFAIDVNEWGLPNPLEEYRAKVPQRIEQYPPLKNKNENRRAS